jgi:hypothetical protein
MIIIQLSGGTFNEKPGEKKSASQSCQRSRYLVSESEVEPEQDHQHYRSGVETGEMSEGKDNSKVFWTD